MKTPSSTSTTGNRDEQSHAVLMHVPHLPRQAKHLSDCSGFTDSTVSCTSVLTSTSSTVLEIEEVQLAPEDKISLPTTHEPSPTNPQPKITREDSLDEDKNSEEDFMKSDGAAESKTSLTKKKNPQTQKESSDLTLHRRSKNPQSCLKANTSTRAKEEAGFPKKTIRFSTCTIHYHKSTIGSYAHWIDNLMDLGPPLALGDHTRSEILRHVPYNHHHSPHHDVVVVKKNNNKHNGGGNNKNNSNKARKNASKDHAPRLTAHERVVRLLHNGHSLFDIEDGMQQMHKDRRMRQRELRQKRRDDDDKQPSTTIKGKHFWQRIHQRWQAQKPVRGNVTSAR